MLTKLQYGFRTRAEDKELDIILSSLKGKDRTNFIREALYFYIRNKNIIEQISKNIAEIEQISKDIAEIKEILKNHVEKITPNQDFVPLKADTNGKKKNNEELLKGLVNDFLNM